MTGTVLSYEGVPASNDIVVLSSGAFKRSTATDTNGAFTVTGVPVPYDAWIEAKVGPSVRYLGLTRPDPTLNDLLSRSAQARSATLSGQLTGGTYPEPVGVGTRLVFASPETLPAIDYLFSNVDYSADGSFSSAMQWQGPGSTTGTLFALQVVTELQGTEFLPTQYSYGSLNGVSLEDTGTLAGQTVSLSSVPTSTMSVTVAEKSGYTFGEENVQLSVAPNVALIIWLSGAVLATPQTFAAPVIAGTSLAVSANATNDAGAFIEATQTGLAADSTIVLTIPDPPEALTPTDGATDVGQSTTFSWSPYPNGVHCLEVFPGKYGQAFFIFTAGTSASIADFNALTSTTKFTWYVVGAAPLASVDDLATPDHLDAFYNGQLHSPLPGVIPHAPGNVTVGVSAPRSFAPP